MLIPPWWFYMGTWNIVRYCTDILSAIPSKVTDASIVLSIEKKEEK